MSSRTKSTVFLLTGATGDLGAALARQLARRGHPLVLAATASEALGALNTDCWGLGARAVAIPTDVTNEADCQQLIERAIEAFGRIDVLINSAGMPMHVESDSRTDQSARDELWRTTYAGTRDCSRFALPYLRSLPGKPAGQIVCTGVSNDAGNCADASAQRVLLESLRAEAAAHNIAVTVVYPAAMPNWRCDPSFDAGGNESRPPASGAEEAIFIDDCANEILAAAESRRPTLVVNGRRGFWRWLHRLSPAWVDNLTLRSRN